MLGFFPFYLPWVLFVVLCQAGKESFGDEFACQDPNRGVPFWKSFPAHTKKQRKPHEFGVTQAEMLGNGHSRTNVLQTKIIIGKMWIP